MQENDYECMCASGWGGKNCDTSVNECASNPCQNGGECEDGQNRYTCNCPVGCVLKMFTRCELGNVVLGVMTCGSE